MEPGVLTDPAMGTVAAAEVEHALARVQGRGELT